MASERVRRLRHGFRLLAHPRKVLRYFRWEREAKRRPLHMRALPGAVEIELTNRCNLACIQCLRSQGMRKYEQGDMTLERFGKILAQFPDLLVLALNGFGEPLLNRDFFPIVAHARARLPWAKILIYSNGMLIDDRVAALLPASGLSEINVSIDAARPDTYEEVRRGGELPIVHRNLRRLLAAREAQGSRLPRVGVNFVMLNENAGELLGFLEQAKELGVDFVNCVSYATYDWGFVNRRSRESYEREIEAARARIAELGLVCKSLPGDLSWTDPSRPFDCDFFWGRSTRIAFDGSVTLGCCTPFKETYSYGNVLETPFAEIWNGPRYGENRERARRRMPPVAACAECLRANQAFFSDQRMLVPLTAKRER